MVGIRDQPEGKVSNLHGLRKAKLQADRQANEEVSAHQFLSDLNQRGLNPAWLERLKKLV